MRKFVVAMALRPAAPIQNAGRVVTGIVTTQVFWRKVVGVKTSQLSK